MSIRFALSFTLLLVSAMLFAAEKPNIIIIYTDDQGYGDVSALNPQAKFKTPALDRLINEGLTFTDGHSPDSVCTPSRYGLLTGRYSWRTGLQKGVLGADADCLIEDGRMTIASLLRDHGYQTALVGKWHLGMQFVGSLGQGRDWSQPFTDGPIQKGFDYFYGIPASMNFGVLTYLEQNRITVPPTLWTKKKPGLVTHDRASYRITPPYDSEKGKNNLEIAPNFDDVDCLKIFTEKSIEWMDTAVTNNKPFFLYLPFTSPHKPVIPRDEFKGKSQCGAYGDFMIETDYWVGQILRAIDRMGVDENTMIIFSSDNGAENTYKERINLYQHHSNLMLRDGKRSLYEGGHRVPFLIRWPAGIQAGTVCNVPVCQTDLLATFAEMLGAQLPEHAGEDSASFYPAFSGKEFSRPPLIHNSFRGTKALRVGDWKLVTGGSGGKKAKQSGIKRELYNLKDDLSETTDLASSHPERVAEMEALLQKLIAGPSSVR